MPKPSLWNIKGNYFYVFFSLLVTDIDLVAAHTAKSKLAQIQSNGVLTSTNTKITEDRTDFEEILLEVWLNDQNLHETVLVLRRTNGRVLLRGEDLTRWRINLLNISQENYQNESYYLLDKLAKYRINEADQSLRINIQSENLLPSVLNIRDPSFVIPQMPSPGGFLNYDISAQQSQGTRTIGAQLELGIFGGGGVGITRMLARNLSINPDFVRLESTWTVDIPERRASLRIGDSINRSGAWGRSVRFGGIQWGTNFSTQPDFITFPLPSLSGQTALPSTAELFINNVRMYQSDVQPGPFSLRELPVVTGAGEMRLIMRDFLGREQVITQPYYSVPSLLRKGLSDYSYELGVVRNNFGSVSNNYGEMMFSGTHRYGFTNSFTSEIRGEVMANRQNIGFSATMLLPRGIGVLDASVAVSHNAIGGGGLLGLGFERQTQRFGFGIRTQFTTPHFDQLGLITNVHAPIQQTTARIGWNYARLGSIGIGYLRLNNRSHIDSEIINASFNRNLTQNWFLSLSAFQNLKGAQDYAIGLVLTRVLGDRTTASLNFNHINGSPSLLASVQQNLPAGTGIGYRVIAGTQNDGHFQGTLNLQNNYGAIAMEAAHVSGIDAFRTSANGGIAVLGGKGFFSRIISDSFAVVRVPGYPKVNVYYENQSVARTDNSGTAFVPRLRPYQKNRLSIEQMDLPLDASIDKLEIIATPYFRSGYYIEFPVKRANGASLRILMKDGKFAPAGATVQIVGSDKTFPIGLDGQAYITGLEKNNQLKVILSAQQFCEFTVSYPGSTELLPDLGNFICQ